VRVELLATACSASSFVLNVPISFELQRESVELAALAWADVADRLPLQTDSQSTRYRPRRRRRSFCSLLFTPIGRRASVFCLLAVRSRYQWLAKAGKMLVSVPSAWFHDRKARGTRSGLALRP